MEYGHRCKFELSGTLSSVSEGGTCAVHFTLPAPDHQNSRPTPENGRFAKHSCKILSNGTTRKENHGKLATKIIEFVHTALRGCELRHPMQSPERLQRLPALSPIKMTCNYCRPGYICCSTCRTVWILLVTCPLDPACTSGAVTGVRLLVLTFCPPRTPFKLALAHFLFASCFERCFSHWYVPLRTPRELLEQQNNWQFSVFERATELS